MSRAARSAIAAAVLLVIVGMLLPDGSERLTPTRIGVMRTMEPRISSRSLALTTAWATWSSATDI